MFRLSKLSHLAASAKNALTSRSSATTHQNLTTINTSVQTLTQTTQTYKGGLLAAASISSSEATLAQDIKNAISDAKASEMVSEAEANEIVKYIVEVLEVSIRACMQALGEKKEELKRAGLEGTVKGDMVDLRALTNDLGKALLEKAPAGTRPEGEKAIKTIDEDFEETVKSFAASAAAA
ncbi:Hypothetical predicted protein [Lecanosticta acicola]|uniref:Uncharacterized protein n=1 Tax=Lecanosticta acicola TaxID=111012 RepID=A0AAI8Z3J0_9PEZI|nr:Hypothetical predicted protein [Lecanosticta acicola]